MEEKKKRRGYATPEQQYEATKRYLKTEKGKLASDRANCKSKGKKFIREYASLEELEELIQLIQQKKEDIQ